MNDYLQWAGDGQKLLGFALSLLTLLGFAGRWFWGSVSKRVSEGVSNLSTGHKAIADRVDLIEKDVASIVIEVGGMRSRMGTIEARIETLATAHEVRELAIMMSGIKATIEVQKNQFEILYKAALEASRGSTGAR